MPVRAARRPSVRAKRIIISYTAEPPVCNRTMRVANDEFCTGLRTLLDAATSEGSVYLEQKRLLRTGPDADLHATQRPFPLVFRATNGAPKKSGNRKSLSTVVDAESLPGFWQAYTDTLKKGAVGLQKKEKKKAKKA